MSIQNGRSAQEMERLSVFELAGQLYGLDIMKSREVISLPRYTPLPNSVEIYSGVFNLRGEIFPLVDVSPILGLPSKHIQPDDMVILLDDVAEFAIGVLVDKIHSVVPYFPGEIKMARGLVSKQMEKYLQGVLNYKGEENLIHILDLDSVFRTKQILAHS